LVNGDTVAIGPNTRAHALIAGNIAYALDAALDRKHWDVLMSFAVDTGPNTVRDPDVLVDSGGDGKDVVANAPALLAEVLSPSSTTIDLGEKPAEYLRIPSLMTYLVLAQNEPKAWLWQRESPAFVSGPRVVAGIDRSITIGALSLDLPLSEIYRGIV
jgi:Uma2 family endonuclease